MGAKHTDDDIIFFHELAYWIIATLPFLFNSTHENIVRQSIPIISDLSSFDDWALLLDLLVLFVDIDTMYKKKVFWIYKLFFYL